MVLPLALHYLKGQNEFNMRYYHIRTFFFLIIIYAHSLPKLIILAAAQKLVAR